MTAFIDTNVLVRHLTGDPPAQAAKATAYLRLADELLLPDLILAEVAYVLESFYEAPRRQVAETNLTCSPIGAPTPGCVGRAPLMPSRPVRPPAP